MVSTLPLEAMTTPAPASSALATTVPAQFGLEVRNIDDLTQLARLLAVSGLFGRNGNQEAQIAECAIRLMAGMEAGFSPFASATGIHIIEGKPAFSSNLLAQAVRRHPVYDYQVIEHTDQLCKIQFSANKQPVGLGVFTIDMARRAGLADKQIWRKYPESMLFARALSSGMRTHCPDALGGAVAYVPEELGDERVTIEAVTVIEEPHPAAPPPAAAPPVDPALIQAARNACDRAGLTDAGLLAFLYPCSDLAELPIDKLQRLAKAGVSPETVERCNIAGEAAAELPARWDLPAEPPSPQPTEAAPQ